MKIKMFAPLAGLISLVLAGGSTYSADLPQIRTPVAAERPVLKEKALPSRPPAGSVAPDSGAWHTFVRVTAPQIASADGIRVVWFPDDDNSKPQAGAMTATVRKRIVPDEVEIEIPRNAGGAGGGVVRILAIMPKQLQPVFLARFTVLSPVQAGQPIGKLAAPPREKPKLLPPAAVTGFTAKSTGPDRIELSWNPAPGVTEYRLARKDLGGNIHRFNVSAATNASGYTDTGLRPSTYQYTIVPINTAGENAVDPPSASATVTQACVPATVKLRASAGRERCFGAIGMQCAGGRMGTKKEDEIAEAAAPPGVINSDCTITQDVAVGSIMHDNCCVTNHGNGAYCSGEAPGTDELDPVCMREWRKAVWNKIDGRTWRHTFGPYLSDDQGDQLGTMTARSAKTNGLLGFRDDPQPWPGPERYSTRQLVAPPGTPLDIDSAAYCASGRFSLTDWKGPALTKGSDYAKWIADKENEIRGRDAWINSKIAEKDAAWKRGDLIKVGALEVEINAARAQNTAANIDLGKLVALREAQYLARVTEWGVCQ